MASAFAELLKQLAPVVNRELESFFSVLKERCVRQGASTELVDALADLTLRGGKRLRPVLAYVAYKAVSKPEDEVELIRALMSLEILHSYLLVHDDIMDESDIRRGGEALHLSLGKHSASPKL